MTIVGHNGAMTASHNELPIGIFDSGIGGLTVVRAVRAELPNENLIYLGDTARLPYGTKSPASISRYATQATAKLHDQGIKLLVVACNTASAVALDGLREQLDPLPVHFQQPVHVALDVLPAGRLFDQLGVLADELDFDHGSRLERGIGTASHGCERVRFVPKLVAVSTPGTQERRTA